MPTRFRVRLSAGVVAMGFIAASLGLSAPSSAALRISFPAGADMQFLGELPPGQDEILGSSRIVSVDEDAERLYQIYSSRSDENSFHIREFDLNDPVPRVLRDRRVLSNSEFSSTTAASTARTALDTRRNRLILINDNRSAVCTNCRDPQPGFRLEVFDLSTLTAVKSVNLTTKLGVIFLAGITYSKSDDRIYFVGQFDPVQGLNPVGAVPPTHTTTVGALEAGSFDLAWIRPVQSCPVPIAALGRGVQIVRSALRPALYFGCIRPGVYPGESGLVRITISPTMDSVSAQTAPVEYFPVSGQYTGGGGIQGVTAYDSVSDRFYMLSVSIRTPGAWVFDARISAWIGFVAGRNFTGRNLGVDPRAGRVYLGGERWLVASDGAQTPVPQGRVVDLPQAVNRPIIVLPKSHRLLVWQSPMEAYAVLRDVALPSDPVQPVEYDSLTKDVDEGPTTLSIYSAGASGFGSRYHLVGGYGGAVSFANDVNGTQPLTLADKSPGDRGVYNARVASVDVRSVGASASAQSIAPDSVTAEDLNSLRDDAAQKTGQNKSLGSWPYPAVACVDPDSNAQTSSTETMGSRSSVSCDLASTAAVASSSQGGSSADGVGVGSSSFDSKVVKDAKLGAVTESTGTARGIELRSPVGSVSIARVQNTVRTVARGRPGSAQVSWTRTLSGVVVKDSNGSVLFSCDAASQCRVDQAVEAMNNALGSRVHITIPEGEVISTPRGAYAGIQKTDREYFSGLTLNNDNDRALPALQVVVLNDTVDKSRLLVQLAGVRASSIYGISLLDVGVGSKGGSVLGESRINVVAPEAAAALGQNHPGSRPSVNRSVPLIERFVQAALFLIRSPMEAALVAGLLGLLMLPAWSAFRRRRLLGVLDRANGAA